MCIGVGSFLLNILPARVLLSVYCYLICEAELIISDTEIQTRFFMG